MLYKTAEKDPLSQDVVLQPVQLLALGDALSLTELRGYAEAEILLS